MSPRALPTAEKHCEADSSAAARRAKKREQDRRCQRMARERTKNRITYLEGLISDLKHQGTTEQMQTLWKERDEAVADRHRLAQTLRTIQRVLQSSQPELSRSAMESNRPSGQHLTPVDDLTSDGFVGAGLQLGLLDDCIGLLSNEDASKPKNTSAVNNHSKSVPSSEIACDPYDQHVSKGVSALSTQIIEDIPNDDWVDERAENSFDCAAFDPNPNETHAESALFLSGTEWIERDLDPIIPRPTDQCSCFSRPSHIVEPVSLWRFANETLSRPTACSAHISKTEDGLEEDIPVRAMIEGWDSAERSVGGTLPPAWQKLRQIDETLFSSCGNTERLAILQLMHSLLCYHVKPSPERRAKLPEWYLARPSQTIAHSYAIDYFAWPGLRERFVFQQHRYCSNQFWVYFRSCLHILWPFEFRDCYTRNISSGKYNVSPTFLERIKDIRAWTMSPDIFREWPELLSDMPVYDSLSMVMTTHWPQTQDEHHKKNTDPSQLGQPDVILEFLDARDSVIDQGNGPDVLLQVTEAEFPISLPQDTFLTITRTDFGVE